MGGLVIETVRPGVQFVPDAANAFRRAEAEVLAEFGRPIDVNSTYRSWSKQMEMFDAWNAYVASGFKWAYYPGHSKAVHPSESFHVSGLAVDSDDWRNARIVAILADHGFIRNRLNVPNEQHHFEYIRARDNHYGEEIDMPLNDADISKIRDLIRAEVGRAVWERKSAVNGLRFGDMARVVFDAVRFGKKGVRSHGELTGALMAEIGAQKIFRAAHGQGEKIDVAALADAIADQLDPIDAEKLAKAILRTAGEAFTEVAN